MELIRPACGDDKPHDPHPVWRGSAAGDFPDCTGCQPDQAGVIDLTAKVLAWARDHQLDDPQPTLVLSIHPAAYAAMRRWILPSLRDVVDNREVPSALPCRVDVDNARPRGSWTLYAVAAEGTISDG